MLHRRAKKQTGLSVRFKPALLLAAVLLYVSVKYVVLVVEVEQVSQKQAAGEEKLHKLEQIHHVRNLIAETLMLLHKAETQSVGGAQSREITTTLAGQVENIVNAFPGGISEGRTYLPRISTQAAALAETGLTHDGMTKLTGALLELKEIILRMEQGYIDGILVHERDMGESFKTVRRVADISLLVGFLAAMAGGWLLFRNLIKPLDTMRRSLVAAARDPENAEKYQLDPSRNSKGVAETLEALNMLLLQVSSGLEDLIASENRMRTRSRELRAILDNVLDAIITADEEGRILSFNASAEYIFGYEAKDVIGRNLKILMPDDVALHHDEYMQRYHETGKAQIIGQGARQVTAVRADGAKFPAELSVSEASPGGRHLYIGAIRDVSEQAIAREHIERTNRMDAIGKMTGGLAHDFNNMLTVVSGNLEMIREMAGDDHAIASFARTAEKATARGASLTQRLLTFSRKQDLQPVYTEMGDAIRDAVELIRRGLSDDINLEIATQDDLWPVRIDRSQLDNALVNLAFNARDAMDGKGTIKIQAENVMLDERLADELPDIQPGEYVRVSVVDHGAGISPEIKERVFEPFFTTKAESKGTGLGLSMVYGFIRQSGGAVLIDTVEGKGTSVSLLLPHCRVAGNTEVEDTSPAEHADATDIGLKGHVLVVEDDDDLRHYVAGLLTAAGMDVVTADSGPDVFDAMEDIYRLDLLLTDVVMPGGMNGEDVADYVTEIFPEVEVLYMSGYTREALMEEGRIREGVTLLQKPFTRSKVLSTVRDMLLQGTPSKADSEEENASS